MIPTLHFRKNSEKKQEWERTLTGIACLQHAVEPVLQMQLGCPCLHWFQFNCDVLVGVEVFTYNVNQNDWDNYQSHCPSPAWDTRAQMETNGCITDHTK